MDIQIRIWIKQKRNRQNHIHNHIQFCNKIFIMLKKFRIRMSGYDRIKSYQLAPYQLYISNNFHCEIYFLYRIFAHLETTVLISDAANNQNVKSGVQRSDRLYKLQTGVIGGAIWLE